MVLDVLPPEVHHDFEQVGAPLRGMQRLDDTRRKRVEKQVEVVGDDLFAGEGG